jgi:hypothetical protein
VHFDTKLGVHSLRSNDYVVWLSLFRDLLEPMPIWWLSLLVWSIFGWGGLQLFCGEKKFWEMLVWY